MTNIDSAGCTNRTAVPRKRFKSTPDVDLSVQRKILIPTRSVNKRGWAAGFRFDVGGTVNCVWLVRWVWGII